MIFDDNSGSTYYAISCGVPSDGDLDVETNIGTDYYFNEPNDFILWGQDTLYPHVSSNSGSEYYFLNCNTESDLDLDLQSNSGTAYYYSPEFNCVSFCGGATTILNYSFTRGFPDELTHTRASGATLVDASGNVVWADENLVPYSDFSSGWVVSRAALASEGSSTPTDAVAYSITEDATAANSHYARETLDNHAGAIVTMSCYLKASGRSQAFLSNNHGGGSLQRASVFDLSTGAVTFDGADVLSSGMEDVGDGWYWCWVTLVAYDTLYDVGGVVANSPFYDGDGRESTLVAGVKVQRGTVQPFVATTGSAYHAPRITHDADGNVLGYLHEPQGTNIVESNMAIVVSDFGVVSTPDDGISCPVVGATVEDIRDSTAGTKRFRLPYITPTAGVDYTASLFFKANGRRYFNFKLGNENANANSNLGTTKVDATLGTADGDGVIESLGGDWYRVSIHGAAVDTNTITIWGYFLDDGGTYGSYPPDTEKGWLIAAPQLETSTVATSLIHTYGAQATRQADTVDPYVVAGLSEVDSFTFLGKFSLLEDTRMGVLGISNGGTQVFKLDMQRSSSLHYVIDRSDPIGGFSDFNFDRTSDVADMRVAASYSSSLRGVDANGGGATELVAKSMSTSAARGFDRLTIGDANTNAIFKTVRIIGTYKTPAQLTALTL